MSQCEAKVFPNEPLHGRIYVRSRQCRLKAVGTFDSKALCRVHSPEGRQSLVDKRRERLVSAARQRESAAEERLAARRYERIGREFERAVLGAVADAGQPADGTFALAFSEARVLLRDEPPDPGPAPPDDGR